MEIHQNAALLGLPAISNVSPAECLRLYGTLPVVQQEAAVELLDAAEKLAAVDEAIGELVGLLESIVARTKGETRAEAAQAAAHLGEVKKAFDTFLEASEELL